MVRFTANFPLQSLSNVFCLFLECSFCSVIKTNLMIGKGRGISVLHMARHLVSAHGPSVLFRGLGRVHELGVF